MVFFGENPPENGDEFLSWPKPLDAVAEAKEGFLLQSVVYDWCCTLLGWVLSRVLPSMWCSPGQMWAQDTSSITIIGLLRRGVSKGRGSLGNPEHS